MSVVLTQPIGAATDEPFTFQDLLNVAIEFPQSPGAYFSNPQSTVTCIPSLLNPANQWCAPKASAIQFEPTDYHITYSQPPRCTDCGPHVTTPEPSMAWFLVAALILIMVGPRCLRFARKSIAKHKSRRMERRLNRQIAQWIRGGAR